MKNNLFEIFLQKIGFSPKKENMYIKVRKTDYDLMKKMIERQDNFSIQIIQQTQQIDTLKNQIERLTKENKKKDIETYKNYFEARKELEKREKQ